MKWIFSTGFLKLHRYWISWKSVQWEQSSSMRTDRQTDRQTDTDMTKLIVALRNFANAPKIFRRRGTPGTFTPYIPVTCFHCLSMDVRGDIYSCTNSPLYQLHIKGGHPSKEIAHKQCRTVSSKRFTCNACTVDVDLLPLCIKTQTQLHLPAQYASFVCKISHTMCINLKVSIKYSVHFVSVCEISQQKSCMLWPWFLKVSYNSRMMGQIRTEKII